MAVAIPQFKLMGLNERTKLEEFCRFYRLMLSGREEITHYFVAIVKFTF
jgi:hypothetical protein